MATTNEFDEAINEKVEPIYIDDPDTGETYTLEFDRESVKFAESRGISIQMVTDFPMTYVPELFWCAFRMHHKSRISRERAEKILFDGLGGLEDGAIERLGRLFAKPYDDLVLTEAKRKNAKMTMRL